MHRNVKFPLKIIKLLSIQTFISFKLTSHNHNQTFDRPKRKKKNGFFLPGLIQASKRVKNGDREIPFQK